MLRTVVVEESSWAWECSGRCDEINNVVDRQKGGRWWVVSGRSSSWQSELRTRARLEPTLALTDHTQHPRSDFCMSFFTPQSEFSEVREFVSSVLSPQARPPAFGIAHGSTSRWKVATTDKTAASFRRPSFLDIRSSPQWLCYRQRLKSTLDETKEQSLSISI